MGESTRNLTGEGVGTGNAFASWHGLVKGRLNCSGVFMAGLWSGGIYVVTGR